MKRYSMFLSAAGLMLAMSGCYMSEAEDLEELEESAAGSAAVSGGQCTASLDCVGSNCTGQQDWRAQLKRTGSQNGFDVYLYVGSYQERIPVTIAQQHTPDEPVTRDFNGTQVNAHVFKGQFGSPGSGSRRSGCSASGASDEIEVAAAVDGSNRIRYSFWICDSTSPNLRRPYVGISAQNCHSGSLR
jgi:hypothetical protein